MQPASMILIYVIVWWVLFFLALPMGIKGSGVNVETGAPDIPHLKVKVVWVSVVSLMVSTLIILGLMQWGENFYTWAKTGNWPFSLSGR